MSLWHTCPAGHSWAVRLAPGDELPACPRCGLSAIPLEAGEELATQRLGGVVALEVDVKAPIRPSSGPPTVARPRFNSPLERFPDHARDQRLPQLPGYEILEVLGQGGMGVVYRARQVALDRHVALKMIRDGRLSSAEELLRFRAEALAVAQMTHPHIVAIHEIGEYDGLPYISLELVEGGTLQDWLGDRAQPEGEAAALVEQLARAVHVAHTRGLVHRDLKPANILLDWTVPPAERTRLSQANPKIADFGLAKRIGQSDGLTMTGQILGTPSYMAPEQANPARGAVGPWTDVYALGAILYQLLTGRPPFLESTGVETLHLVLDSDPVAPSRLRREVPRDLETIVLKCLAKDPRQRYVSAEALADDLARFQAGEPILGRQPSLLERWKRRVRRNPVVATLAGGLALVACGILLALALIWRNAAHHFHVGVQVVDDILTAVAQLEKTADESRNPADFDKALEELNRATEHANRSRHPHQLQAVGVIRERLLLHRLQKLDERTDQARNQALVDSLDHARSQLDLGVEPLRQALRANDIPVGSGPVEIATAVNNRPLIRDTLRDALVACYAGCSNLAEETALRDALALLDSSPDAKSGLRLLAEDPEHLLTPNYRHLLRRLPPAYTLATAMRLERYNRRTEAIRLLREGILQEPEAFWLHLYLGHLLQSHQPQEALTAYWAALSLRNTSAPTLLRIGRVLVRTGQLEEGIGCLERAARLQPGCTRTREHLALALLELSHRELSAGNLNDAATRFLQALERTPKPTP